MRTGLAAAAVCAITVAAVAAEPPTDIVDAADAASVPGRHAFVVGIDQFDDDAFPALEWAVSDARAMAGVLGRVDEGWSVTQATGADRTDNARLLQDLDAFLAELGPDDTVLLYVSSHGVVDYVDGRPRRYLVTSDSDHEDLPETAIEVQQLLQRIDGSLPRWKVVILATCFGGDGAGIRSAPDPRAEGRRGPSRLQPMNAWPRRATVVLSASYMDGPAWEDPQLGHEIYTYYLLEALAHPHDETVDLNGDGALSAFEAHGYASGHTVDRTGGRQFPSANLDAVGERDVVLLGDPEAQPRRAVFWSFLGQRRGNESVELWIDGQRVERGTSAHVLEPGKHVLETGTPGFRERSRRLSFRIRSGQAVDVSDLVARAQDQWLGAGIGVLFLPGAEGYNQAFGRQDDPYQLPGASTSLRLGFEQRLWPRWPLAPTPAITLHWWPAAPYSGGLSSPARTAAADLALLVERRMFHVSPAVGPAVAAVYLRSTGREGALLTAAIGAAARLRVRLGGRFSLRISGNLLVTRCEPLSLPTQVMLMPSLAVDIGVVL